MAVSELGRLPGFRVGAIGPLFICVFHRTATLERLELLQRLQTEHLTRVPKLYALNVITGESLQSPGPGVREKSAALQIEFDDKTVAAGTVLCMRGLGAVIARGFLAGLALISGGSKPTEVFKTVAEGALWMSKLPDAPPELAANRSLVEDLEAFVASVTSI